MHNPYAPVSTTDPTTSVSRLAILWNAIVCCGLATFSTLVYTTFKIHFAEYNLTGDELGMVRSIVGDLSQVALVLFFLVTLSTAPLHQRPLTTRAIALLVCALISFHFTRHQFTQASLIRGLVATIVLAPALFCGCGYPKLMQRCILWLRKSRPVGLAQSPSDG